jgi:hypothetical protein
MEYVFRAIVFAAMLMTSGLSIAQNDLCSTFLEYERDTNKKLPSQVDSATEIIQVRVNCQLKIVSYVMRFTRDESELASGWQERKARQHQQLHCNNNGLASQAKWTARTVLHSTDGLKMLSEFMTRPSDCK